jgi:hypothetical protein
MNIKKGEIGLIVFNLVILIAFAIYYLTNGNSEFLLYIGVVLFFIILIGYNLSRVGLDYIALWGLSIWNLLHMLGGSLKVGGVVLYNLHVINIIDKGGDFMILKMDQVFHFYGFGVAAFVVFQLIYPHMNEKAKPAFMIFIAWIGAMGLGALNEVIEFMAFISFAKTGVGDVYNTGLDLVFNLFGTMAGATLGYFLREK